MSAENMKYEMMPQGESEQPTTDGGRVHPDIDRLDTVKQVVLGALTRSKSGVATDLSRLQEVEEELQRMEDELPELECELQALQDQLPEGGELGEEDDVDFEMPKSEFAEEVEGLLQELKAKQQEFQSKADRHLELLNQVHEARESLGQRVTQLFDKLFENSENVQRDIDEAQRALDSLNAEPDVSERINPFVKELDNIKARRCLFFGCVDIHPPDL